MLNDYSQRGGVTADTYVGLLHQYAQQHFVNGALDLQEDYNPDTGKVIVGLARSHHYNHSSYPDLVITGLAGLRPRADSTLEVNPLIPTETAKAIGPSISWAPIRSTARMSSGFCLLRRQKRVTR